MRHARRLGTWHAVPDGPSMWSKMQSIRDAAETCGSSASTRLRAAAFDMDSKLVERAKPYGGPVVEDGSSVQLLQHVSTVQLFESYRASSDCVFEEAAGEGCMDKA